MSEPAEQPAPTAEVVATPRFFCHRCIAEIADVGQEFKCPNCSSGFIEQLQTANRDNPLNNSAEGASTARNGGRVNDLTFLMSGGRVRNSRPDSLLEQLILSIGAGAVPGATTGGTPFVLVGAPGDYLMGGDEVTGLDAVVTQLLGQLENVGPPPMPTNLIDNIPIEDVSEERAAAKTTCSVCWELFKKDEKIARLACDHIFHKPCIEPWLKLHATCPICRHRLMPDNPTNLRGPLTASHLLTGNGTPRPSMTVPRIGLRRIFRRVNTGPIHNIYTSTWGQPPPPARPEDDLVLDPITNRPTTQSAARGYNMDIDYD